MWSRRSKPAGTAGDVLVLSVEGMHCGSCGLTIDDAVEDVEDVPGVARATTSFRTGLTEVVLADGADPAQVGAGRDCCGRLGRVRRRAAKGPAVTDGSPSCR
jgi:copper chaperone